MNTLIATMVAATLTAQYNQGAGSNVGFDEVEQSVQDKRTGRWIKKKVRKRAKSDRYGNAEGSKYDLAVDGAFEGQTVAVIQLYDFDFSRPRKALAEKGFSVYRWRNRPPSPKALAVALKKSSQLWIISGDRRQLNKHHLKVIKAFFDEGHGVYVWGDNQPFYSDANFVTQALVDVTMKGNLVGDKSVGISEQPGLPGVAENHLLTTGLEHIYEGITIATLQNASHLTPLIYGSAKNLVAAAYEKNGKRLIVDGGFTRLYNKWDTAGTARYVKNAAAWLHNAERFGAKVSMK